MSAVATASDMEVASLIEHRSPDGLLPHPSSDSDDPNDPQTSTATLSTLLQSRTMSPAEAATTLSGQTPTEGPRDNSEELRRVDSVLPQTSGPEAQQAQRDRPAERAEQHAAKLSGAMDGPNGSASAKAPTVRESGSIADFLLGQRNGQKRAAPDGPVPAHDSALSQQPNGLVRSEDSAKLGANGLTAIMHQPEGSASNNAAVGAQGGLVSVQDMLQHASEQATNLIAAASNLGRSNGHEGNAQPSGALPDQDLVQPAEDEAGPSGALPDQDMVEPAEEEAGPSSSASCAQIAAPAPQQRKRKFDSGPNPLVSDHSILWHSLLCVSFCCRTT